METIRKFALICGIALAFGGAAAGEAASPVPAGAANDGQLAAARREAQILSGFRADPRLRVYDLTVGVDGDRVSLGGAVDSDDAKVLAGRSAADADGIRRVDNRIRVDASAVAPSRAQTARSAEAIIGDAAVSASVRSRLLWNTHTEGLDIRIDARNGTVTLAGSAISYAERDVAGIVATNTNGVTGVNNELTLTDQPRPVAKAGPESDESARAPSDAWITSRVRSSLLLTRGVGGVAVTTRRGVVSLSGTVPTKADRDSAMQVAQDTRGVKDVVADGLTAG